MKVLARVCLAIAGIAFVGGLLLGSVPARVRPAVIDPPPGEQEVNCGTVFSDTKWSSDDACEGPRIARGGLMFIAFVVSVLAFVSGVLLIVITMRRYPAVAT